MYEKRRRRGGDAPREERYVDWDNPEDVEEAPEGYYDETEGEDWYEPGPEDPDYDLSEAAGYTAWEPPGRSTPFPSWAIALLSILLIAAILLPLLLRVR